MSQYDEFKIMIDDYLKKYGKTANYSSCLHDTSYSDAENVYLYENSRRDIEVINMDQIAQEPYRRVRFPESNKTEDSIATNDAFVISSDNNGILLNLKTRN